MVVPVAADHEVKEELPLVKSVLKVEAGRPVSLGQVFSVGLQSVYVCARARGAAASAAARVDFEKCMLSSLSVKVVKGELCCLFFLFWVKFIVSKRKALPYKGVWWFAGKDRLSW